MRLVIISTAPFIYESEGIFAYSPYVEELKIWNKYVDEIAFCCPIWEDSNGLLISKLPFDFNKHFVLKDFNVKSISEITKSLFFVLYNLIIVFKSMIWADHIHLRCPGNIGLLACLVQILFPFKTKTAKYAGNWDPKSKQPWSYRFQKWILNNTFLTRNMKVLVYGEWKNQSKNSIPFFTATYSDSEKIAIGIKSLQLTIQFIFVGTLVKGKNPLYAIQLVEALHKKEYKVALNLYGAGVEKQYLENYIFENKLTECIFLRGNQDKEKLKLAYQKSHFVVLPSESEGWPKAIAEGMFWGCVPLATRVSCVPYMIDNGKRGVLLKMDMEEDIFKIESIIQNQDVFDEISKEACEWSSIYTIEAFEYEISKMILNES